MSLFHHLTRRLANNDGAVFFLERAGSRSGKALRDKGALAIAGAQGIQHVPTAPLFRGDLLGAFEQSALPEVLLICSNPDQLPSILNSVVQLLERMNDERQLTREMDLPVFVLSSNGIYYQRLRQQFIERLEEATLLGRLPDLWPDIMPAIVGRLVRGVTIQTGLREGTGGDAVYVPGPPGITRLAGGDQTVRHRACELLSGRGGWFELARHDSATRLEFDKAMVNLSANLLGQFYATDAEGRFTALRVCEIVTAEHEKEIRVLAQHVFDVGRAVKVYGAGEKFSDVFAQMLQTTHQHDEHVPSTLQWISMRLRQGKLEAKLTPTEEWLLDPLIRYAHAAGLHETGHYFETLKKRAIENLTQLARTNSSNKHG